MIITAVSGKMVFDYFEKTIEELTTMISEEALRMLEDSEDNCFFKPDRYIDRMSAMRKVIEIKKGLILT